MNRTLLLTVLTAVLAVMPFSNNLIAQDTHNWTNTTGSPGPFFDVGGNWDLGDAPGPTDNAIFDQNATYEVHWDDITGDRTVSRTSVLAGDVSIINLIGSQFTLTNTSFLEVFNGNLTVDGLGVEASQLFVNQGTLTLDGSVSDLITTGSANINDGGFMNINNGATVTTGAGLVANNTGAECQVNIDGAGSELHVTGPLNVGFGAQGQVNVTGGATLRSNGGTIFNADSSSRVRVDGAGSQWINTGSLTNENQLKIDNGATVSVDGPITNNDNINIGGSGGTLIAASGIANNDNLVVGGNTSEIQGNITNNGEILVFGLDTLTVTGDVTNTAARLNNGLRSDGTTRIEGFYNGGAENTDPEFAPDALVVLVGQYHPGNNGPAITTFANISLEMEATNTTFIELGGTASGDFDRIELFPEVNFDGFQVEPNLTLAGNLDVQLVSGFTLDAGQSFFIIDFNSAATFSGTFAGLAEGDVVLSDSGFDLVISYVGGTGDDVVLTTVANSMPPTNDDWFTSTINAGDFPFTVTGTNVDATLETGEQQLTQTDATVWWFFDAPDDGTVTIDTFGSDFDTQIHIYDGFNSGAQTVADLNPIVNGNGGSEVTFAVTSGTCYEIRVGGFDPDGGGTGDPAAQGNITLNGSFEPDAGLLGDVNCDGAVNLLDVGPFVELISESLFDAKADINEDGVVNLLDVGPFVALLSGS